MKMSSVSAETIELAADVTTVFGTGLGLDPAQIAHTWSAAGESIGLATTSGVALQGTALNEAGQVGVPKQAFASN